MRLAFTGNLVLYQRCQVCPRALVLSLVIITLACHLLVSPSYPSRFGVHPVITSQLFSCVCLPCRGISTAPVLSSVSPLVHYRCRSSPIPTLPTPPIAIPDPEVLTRESQYPISEPDPVLSCLLSTRAALPPVYSCLSVLIAPHRIPPSLTTTTSISAQASNSHNQSKTRHKKSSYPSPAS